MVINGRYGRAMDVCEYTTVVCIEWVIRPSQCNLRLAWGGVAGAWSVVVVRCENGSCGHLNCAEEPSCLTPVEPLGERDCEQQTSTGTRNIHGVADLLCDGIAIQWHGTWLAETTRADRWSVWVREFWKYWHTLRKQELPPGQPSPQGRDPMHPRVPIARY
jgi:hypothetical protein